VTTTYYVAAKSGCEGPRTPVALTVNALPSVNLGNDTTILQGQVDSLDAGAGFTSYQWSTGATTRKIGADTTGCYSVTVTNASGCTDADTACVTVIAPSDAGIISIISPVNNQCATDSFEVMVRVRNIGSTNASNIPVTVEISGTINVNLNDTIFSIMAPGSDSIMSFGYINGSPGGDTLVIKAYTSYINDLNHLNDTLVVQDTIINAPPLPVGTDFQRCGPGTSLVIAIGNNTVRWYDAPSGGNLLYIGSNYLIMNLNATTTYYAQNGAVCSGQERTPVVARINNASVFLGNDTTAADSLVLDAGPGFVSYLWSNSATLQTTTVYTSDIYIVQVEDSNGCTASDTINVSIIVGIESVVSNSDINLYPNPARTHVKAQFKNAPKGKTLFTIANMQGQIILNEETENSSSKTFNVSGFAKGIYLLKVRTATSTSVYRLVIE
jgi:hypothetical protein